MPVSAFGLRAPIGLALSDNPHGPIEPAAWIGRLVALGARTSRYATSLQGRQLVVAISVPRRDFAAALIGCGWMTATAAPELEAPLDAMRHLEPGTPVRVVTDDYVFTGNFTRLDEATNPPRVLAGGSYWHVDKINALVVLPDALTPVRASRPAVGSVGDMARLGESWDQRLASPSADLAIVGTLAWLRADVGACLWRDADEPQVPSPIASLLLPKDGNAATWSTRLYASAGFEMQLPLPPEVRAVVLDGFGAIKYLTQIEAPVVICVVDRSVGDETAADIVIQLRNTRGEPVSLSADLAWPPPAAVEALAFTVQL